MARKSNLESRTHSQLTENELRFCREYAVDHNGSRAYRVAFPNVTKGTARTNASRLLTNANIKQEIAAIEEVYIRGTKITAKRVLRELASIAFFDPGDIFESGPNGMPVPRNWNELLPSTRKVIQSYKVKRRKVPSADGEQYEIEDIDIRFHSKLDALDKLCKHLGLASDGDGLRKLLDVLGSVQGAEAA